MEDWNIIECAFNSADETINFGSRSFVGSENLFEISTLASFKNDKQEYCQEPLMNAFIKSGKIFFSINKSLRVFEDLACTNLGFDATFDALIDCFCITDDGNYLLLCLQNGTMHCLNACTFEIVFTENLVDTENFSKSLFSACFSEINDNHTTSFIVLLENGMIYRISSNFSEQKEVNDESFKQSLLIQLDFNSDSNKCASFTYPYIAVGIDSVIYLYHLENGFLDSNSYDFTIKKLFPFAINLFIALTDVGEVVLISTETLLVFNMNKNIVLEDMIFIKGEKNQESNFVFAVTKPDELNNRFIQSFKYPDEDNLFSFRLPHLAFLIQPETIIDECIYISKIQSEGRLTELRFQVISETLPEKRLERLLRKRKFEEAEKFATEYKIDLEIVKKAKAQFIVDKLICHTDDINNLLNIFDNIVDYAFIIQCCIDVQSCCNNFDDVRTILNYGYKLVSLSSKKFDSETVYLESTLSNIIYRFDTFMALVKHGFYEYDMQDWKKFYAVNNLFEELIVHLKLRHFQECIIIYNHLDSLTWSFVTETDIQKVLDELFYVTLDAFVPFLYSFIPITLRNFPSSLPIFVSWLLKKIFHIERSCSYEFPENAIEFADKIINLIKVDGGQNTSFQRQCCLNKDAIDDLSNMTQGLEQLKILKDTYNVNIPLLDYLEGPENLIKSLLNIISPNDDYKRLLDNFLGAYMIQNGFNPDELFMNMIKDLLNYQENFWITVVPLLLNCMNSIEFKIQCVLEILEKAEVPWSGKIHEISKLFINISHPSVMYILEKIENEPRLVVLKNKVYRLENVALEDLIDLKFVVERMIYCNTTNLIEDVYKLYKTAEEKSLINFLLICHYTNIGELKTALKILDENSETEVLKCSKKLVNYLFAILKTDMVPKYIENYFKLIIGPIYNRIFKLVDNFDRECYNREKDMVKSLYLLNIKFKKSVSLTDLFDNVKMENLFDDIISDAVHKNTKENSWGNFNHFIEMFYEVAKSLEIPRSEVLVKFCKEIDEIDCILDVANDLYLFGNDPNSLCLIAKLLIDTISTYNCENRTLQDTVLLEETMIEDNSVDRKRFMKALSLSEKLFVKAILNADKYQLQFCVELFSYFQVYFYLIHSFDLKIKWVSKNLFLTNNSSINNIASGKWFVKYYTALIDPFILPRLSNCKYLLKNLFSPKISMNSAEIFVEIKNLRITLQKLYTNGHHLTAYKLVNTFKKVLLNNFSDVNPEIYDPLNELVMHFTMMLIKKCFSADFIDTELAYTLLQSGDVNCTSKVIKKALISYKRDIKKFEVIVKLGIRLQNNIKVIDLHLCQKILLLVKWYKSFGNCPISYDEFFPTDPAILAKQLINCNMLDLAKLIEFCADFNLDLEPYLSVFLKNIILHWKPVYEVEVDMCGFKKLVMKSTEGELFDLVSGVINCASNKESIENDIRKLRHSVNFYHYEVFECLLNVDNCESKDYVSILVLSFLKSYRRISKPNQTETEEWYSYFPDLQCIDPFSEWRLPFTPTLFTKDIWNLIRPEINLKTYTEWFKVADLLKILNKDDICSFVIKEEVLKISKKSTRVNNDWNLVLQYKDLFEEIDACVRNMTDLEMATSAMYHVFTHTSPGADQVNAINLCYKYALKYIEKYSETVGLREAFTKVEKKYYSFSTMQILHSNKLAEKKYLDLVSRPPEKLIETLYSDERILKKADCMILYCPDINKAVDEIALLHKLDINKMRNDLLNIWLSDNNASLENSTVFDTNLFQGDGFIDADLNENNLKRASYMCKSGDKTKWQEELLKIGLNNDVKQISYKARALKCLCIISDPGMLEELTGSDYEMFSNYVDKLFLVSDLENLGFSLDNESLDSCNKRDLLKRLLVQESKNPACIKLMAAICTTYTINEVKFWSIIIKSMIKMKMLKELKEYVNFLKRGDVCHHKKFYKDAWQSIIDFSFNFSTEFGNEELMQKCIENIQLVQSCPVLFYIDFINAIEKCIKIKKYIFAAILVQYLPENKQKYYLKTLLDLNCYLENDIHILEKYGVWGVPYVIKLISEVKN